MKKYFVIEIHSVLFNCLFFGWIVLLAPPKRYAKVLDCDIIKKQRYNQVKVKSLGWILIQHD